MSDRITEAERVEFIEQLRAFAADPAPGVMEFAPALELHRVARLALALIEPPTDDEREALLVRRWLGLVDHADRVAGERDDPLIAELADELRAAAGFRRQGPVTDEPTDTEAQFDIVVWLRSFTGPGSVGTNEAADEIERLRGPVTVAEVQAATDAYDLTDSALDDEWERAGAPLLSKAEMRLNREKLVCAALEAVRATQ